MHMHTHGAYLESFLLSSPFMPYLSSLTSITRMHTHTHTHMHTHGAYLESFLLSAPSVPYFIDKHDTHTHHAYNPCLWPLRNESGEHTVNKSQGQTHTIRSSQYAIVRRGNVPCVTENVCTWEQARSIKASPVARFRRAPTRKSERTPRSLGCVL